MSLYASGAQDARLRPRWKAGWPSVTPGTDEYTRCDRLPTDQPGAAILPAGAALRAAIRSGALKVGARLETRCIWPSSTMSGPRCGPPSCTWPTRAWWSASAAPAWFERPSTYVELTSLYDDLGHGRAPATQVIRAEVTHARDRVAARCSCPSGPGDPAASGSGWLTASRCADAQLPACRARPPEHQLLEEHGLYELSGRRASACSATSRRARRTPWPPRPARSTTRGAALLTMERIAYDDSGRRWSWPLFIVPPATRSRPASLGPTAPSASEAPASAGSQQEVEARPVLRDLDHGAAQHARRVVTAGIHA